MVVITAERAPFRCEMAQLSRLHFGGIFFAGLVGFTAFNANAAEWKLVPTIGLNESYTDNVRLAPKGSEQGSFVTQLSPGFNLTATGPNLKSMLNYVMENSYYSGVNSDMKTNHRLLANANAALVQDLFFLDANAGVTQQNLSPFGPVTENNLNLSNNRTEVRTYAISPYFRKNFSNEVTGEMRYSHDSVSSSNSVYAQTGNQFARQNLADSQSDSFRIGLNSGTDFRVVSWGINANQQKIDYNGLAPLTMGMTTVNLGYALTPRFKLTATGGYEHNSYVSLTGKSSGNFGSLGFAWTPTERTNIVFSAGERFYGKTYALTVSQRARLSMWNLGYNEDVTTTRGQFLVPVTMNTDAFLNQLWQNSIPDPAIRQQVVDGFIRDASLPLSLAQPVNTFTNQVFLQKSLQGSVALTGVRNTVVASIFNSSRENLSVAQGNAAISGLSGNIRQTGTSLVWNLKLSPLTNANASVAYVRSNQTDTAFSDRTRSFRASISKQLQPKLKATVELRHIERDSNLAFGNYSENAITFFMLLGF
jgi:uncharacterized protein (PEP-CTERM system associated)